MPVRDRVELALDDGELDTADLDDVGVAVWLLVWVDVAVEEGVVENEPEPVAVCDRAGVAVPVRDRVALEVGDLEKIKYDEVPEAVVEDVLVWVADMVADAVVDGDPEPVAVSERVLLAVRVREDVLVRVRVALEVGDWDTSTTVGVPEAVADVVLVWVAVAVPDADVENDPEPVAV